MSNESEKSDDAAPGDDQPAPVPGTRGLTALYVFALSTVAVLSIGAQLLVQWQLDNGRDDSRVINLAGRQRMLSQRIAKAAFGLRGAGDAEAGRLRQELAETLTAWSAGHMGLQRGSVPLGLPGNNSDPVRRLFDKIDPDYQQVDTAGRSLVDATGSEEQEERAIATIRRHEGPFLAGMDRIVSQYVLEAEQRVAALRRLELAILSLTLLVLLAEGLLIFRPAVRRIEQAVGHLQTLGQRLRMARDEAEHGSAAKTRLLGNVSHELRTPMTAVLGMTGLARETDDPAERDGYLEIVEEAGGSLLGLLNDLIDAARIDAGHIELEDAPFDPQAIVGRVARVMCLAAEEKGLRLIVAKPPQRLPMVVGDPRRIEQVLVNLVSNGIKWTEAGSVTISCEMVRLAGDRAELRFRVQDTGVGIRPEDQGRVFEPFTQLRGAGEPGRGGAGLGLAICRRIAEAMNAKLELASTPGVGATVTLTGGFLITNETEPSEQSGASPTLAAGGDVLLVEDTEVNQLLVRRLLEKEGRRVSVVGSGEAAIDLYRSERFAIVLVDLQLPGMNGVETAKALRAIDATQERDAPPMVCLTAHTGPAAAAAEQRFDALVTKPIDRYQLITTLNDLLTSDQPTEADTPAKPHPPQPPAEATAKPETGDLDNELATAFLSIAADQLQELEEAASRGDWRAAGVLAHRFRGQLGYFGCEATRSKLAELEDVCQRGSDAAARPLAEAALIDLKAEIEGLKRRANPPTKAPSTERVSGGAPARRR